jgi:cell fate regulator YaaT (PSP1 superfamily)
VIAATVSSPVVELSFKGRRREGYENTDLLEYRTGEYLIVQADRGEDMGVVVLSSANGNGNGRQVEKNGPPKRILRRATIDDIARIQDLRQREDEANQVARKKISDHRLPMKLIDVEQQFDGNRITFYFTAEQRVDFRELVKDLASVFRTRIELRQIGVRDEAGRHGGVGVCGRPLCCTTWIREFAPITLKMAKEQNLSLSPTKLSGVCGRLKCCLRYELEFYSQAQKIYPRPGARFSWNGVACEVVKVDIFREGVHVVDPEAASHWIPLTDIPELPREDRLSFKKKKSSGGQGGCGNTGGGCGAGRGEARSGGSCGSGGGCGSGGSGASSSGSSGCGGCGAPPRRPRRPGKPPGDDAWRN